MHAILNGYEATLWHKQFYTEPAPTHDFFGDTPAVTEGNHMKKDLNIIDFLAQIPWWVSVTISASFYILLKFIVPYFETQSTLVNEVHILWGPSWLRL